ncbi:SRPBCC family protein [Arthrobacter sp. A5]|uniref:SRPBCC family protein n=1 Tax=Arthrobacter sp. A5 TaxID=576926 RepID=UPI003DA8C170
MSDDANAEDRLAMASAVVSATPQQVWRSLTEPSLVKEYFFGTEVATGWKQGSAITYTGEYEGKAYEDKGAVLEVDEPRLLRTSFFSPMSGLPDVPEYYQHVTYRIEAADQGSKVTITQDHNASDEAAEHSSANWQTILDGLARVAPRA